MFFQCRVGSASSMTRLGDSFKIAKFDDGFLGKVNTLVKTTKTPLGQHLEKLGLLFISTSGHTDC